jgi:hypothetical protein
MRTFIDFDFLREYDRIKKRGDKLAEIGSTIEWEPFRVILDPLFKSQTAHPAASSGACSRHL